MKRLLIFIFLLILVLPSQAGLINLTSSLSSEIVPTGVKVKLELKNSGDEAAYNIQARFKISDKQCLSEILPKLEVNQKLEIECVQSSFFHDMLQKAGHKNIFLYKKIYL